MALSDPDVVLLQKAGDLLYGAGRRWQGQFAGDLDISRSTLFRYLTKGIARPPRYVIDRANALLIKRMGEISVLSVALVEAAKSAPVRP